MSRRGENPINRPLLDDAPGVHDDDTIADAADNTEIVGDDDDCGAGAVANLADRIRISSWMVASSAVVGSSASSNFGAVALAIAIRTRWRMPPDSSCGNCLSRDSDAVKCTERNNSTSRVFTLFAAVPARVASTSPI